MAYIKFNDRKVSYYHALTKHRVNVYLSLFNEFGESLLGLGCSDGDLTLQVARKINAPRIFGIDIDAKSLLLAHSKEILTIRSDLNLAFPLKDETIDVVSADQVIEHLHNTDNFVKEIHRVLRPGGYAVISTENLSSWHNIFAILLGKQAFSQHVSSKFYLGNPYSLHYRHPIDFFPHVHIFTVQGLKDIFETYGFWVERIRGAGYFPSPVRIGKTLERIDPIHSYFLSIRIRKPMRKK